VRGSISFSLGCPYEGPVRPDAVARVARLMKEIGVQQIGVADTIGVGTPRATRDAFEAVLAVYPLQDVSAISTTPMARRWPTCTRACRWHIDFDASVAGLGGCPFARGPPQCRYRGRAVPVNGLQIETGVDMTRLVQIGQWISGVLGRKAATRAGNAINARATQAG